jgi:hypothetical protein
VSHFGRGYVPVRRGILEHVFDGRLTPAEHHAFLTILLLADAATGTWRGSSHALTTILGYSSKNTMADAFDGLEAKGYILRDYAPGRRGNYPIVIAKFLFTRGANAGKQIDLGATKRKHGIPEGRLGKLIRKPLFASIAAACSHPVLVSETGEGDDVGDDRGVRSSNVSRSENGECRRSEGGGSEGSSQTPDFNSGSAMGQEKTPESLFTPEYASERSDPVLSYDEYPACPVQSESAFSATPMPHTSAAEQLATQFFLYQGKPVKLNTPATLKLWVSTLNRLIQQYGYDDLHGAMRWSFELDAFWPSKLIRAKDPLGYFERMLSEQIMSRYLGWKTSEANKSKTQTKKEGNYDNQQSHPGTLRSTGKQTLDNAGAAAEAKRRIAERLGCQ